MQELPLNKVLVGDNRIVMKKLPSNSIDLVVTSPPYYGLRDYGGEGGIWGGKNDCEHEWINTPPPRKRSSEDIKDKNSKQATMRGSGYDSKEGNSCLNCGAWRGQLGLEPHPKMFIDHLVQIFREVKRILKPSGSFWLNLGDTYCGSWGNYGKREGKQRERNSKKFDRRGETPDNLRPPQSNVEKTGWLQPKQKLMMPHRAAIALQDDGWILRNDVIWHKTNHMPESVQDRLTKSYENFFFFVKSGKYYFDLDSIRVPSSTQPWSRKSNREVYQGNNPRKGDNPNNPKGKNPGDVWNIPTQPFTGAHFAVFPPKLIEPIIKAACPIDGVVLDPFAGSGTTLRVARKLGRKFIGIEINPEYATMCEARVRGDSYTPPPEGVPKLSTFSKSLRIKTGSSKP